MTTNGNTALQPTPAKPATIKSMLTGDAMKNQIARALPRHLAPDRFIRVALTALTRTPQLAQCDQASFFRCLLDLSQMGLEPDGRRAHLIPFNNRKRNCVECQLIIDYKGLVEMAMRSGQVANIHADVVCENDTFLYDKGEVVTHTIDFKAPRGEMYAAYAICTFKDGTRKAEAMSKDDIDAIRRRSKASGSGPWVTDYNEMAKKTAFRRLSKWLPLSAEYRDALDCDDDVLDVRAQSVNVDAPTSLDGLADTLEEDAEPTESVDPETGEVTEPEPEPTPPELEPETDEGQAEIPEAGTPDKAALREKLELLMKNLGIGTTALIKATGKPVGAMDEAELRDAIGRVERGEIKGRK